MIIREIFKNIGKILQNNTKRFGEGYGFLSSCEDNNLGRNILGYGRWRTVAGTDTLPTVSLISARMAGAFPLLSFFRRRLATSKNVSPIEFCLEMDSDWGWHGLCGFFSVTEDNDLRHYFSLLGTIKVRTVTGESMFSPVSLIIERTITWDGMIALLKSVHYSQNVITVIIRSLAVP